MAEEPLVMYFIVRQSLDMGAGKVGAQCAHAAHMIMIEYFELDEMFQRSPNAALNMSEKDVGHLNRFEEWLNRKINGGFRKVVLRAKDREWEKVKELDHFIVKDAGLTEVEPGSETVIVLWPMRKDERPKIIKRLQTLS